MVLLCAVLQDGWSALMAAGRIESSEVAEELLKFGADPNAANYVSF